jgi:hypothetical protein
MASIYPGKLCNKKVADMTEEEHRQHRVYSRAASAARRARGSSRPLSIHPGKRIRKLAADMTKEELKQSRLYTNSVHNKMCLADPAIKVKGAKYAKEWRLKNPERHKATYCRFLAKRLKDPIRHEAYLAKAREMGIRNIENLPDSYIKGAIHKQTGIPIHEIPNDVVEQRRIKIVIERLIKLTN